MAQLLRVSQRKPRRARAIQRDARPHLVVAQGGVSHRGARRHVPHGSKPPRAHVLQSRFKPLRLQARERFIPIRGGKMGKSALHLHIRAAFPRAQQGVQIVPRRANAAHARIDFEMRQRARMPCAGEFLGLGERLGIEHRKRNAPGDHIFQKLPIRRAQHQHRRLDAVFPQFQRLFRRGHGKAARARAQARRAPQGRRPCPYASAFTTAITAEWVFCAISRKLPAMAAVEMVNLVGLTVRAPAPA